MDPQRGALKVGEFNGIRLVVISEGEAPPGFTLTYLGYDCEREQKLRDIAEGAPGSSLTFTGMHRSYVTGRTSAKD